MLSDATLDFAEDLTTALLGLDAVYARERGKDPSASGRDIERLVVLYLSDRHVAEEFSGYAEARERFAALGRRAAELPEPDRQKYYAQTCESAIAFATWRDAGLPFADQIARFLHVPARPARDDDLERLRAGMHEVLHELGYAGSLGDRMTAWEDRQRVPPDEVAPVLSDFLSDAWDLTDQRIGIPAAKSDGMRVETVSAVPYNAMCDFARRLIRINVDPVLTRPGLRHLAVHEGYPGHYLQFIRRQTGYAAGRAPADGLLSVVNTASSTTFEGIADAGMEIIGWEWSLDDRLSTLLTRYRSGLGTRAAWRLHAEGWDAIEVREELLRDGLAGGEGWVDARMRFISAHDRAALIWSYWQGDPTVRVVWNRVADRPERHRAYFDWIYDRLHSVDSIAMLPA